MTYPVVFSEAKTLELVRQGLSLARYGDGEFNLCSGLDIPCQAFDVRLQDRLRAILIETEDCLVGIPNLHSDTPKAAFWGKYHSATRFLARRAYGSAFISRPDSAPWINTPDYWAALESLWVGQDVTLVRGGARGLSAWDLKGARAVREIVGPISNAFAEHEALLEQIGTPARVIICLGPTATVLAADLAARGVHAIDIGHAGMFLRKFRAGQPMTVTAADKALA